MKQQLKFLAASSLALAFSTVSVTAECYCACINNKEIKVCENKWDANYVYCSGLYCTGYKNETKIPYQETIEYIEAKLLAPIEMDEQKES